MARDKQDVIGQLALAARAVRSTSGKELAALGLHPGQDTVLTAIGAADGLALRDLAITLSVQPPTVTKTIARLAAQGFVEKRASAGDIRQSHAFLTEDGHRALKALKAVRKRVRKKALKGLSEKDQKRLGKLLQRVESNLATLTNREDNGG